MNPTFPPPVCPHCSTRFRDYTALDQHLRDQGDAPRLCPGLRARHDLAVLGRLIDDL